MDLLRRPRGQKWLSAPEQAAPSGQPVLARAFSSLTVINLRLLLVSTIFTMGALQTAFVAQPWLAYHISGSALTLGLVALAKGLPSVALTLFAGVVADRFDKRAVLLTTQIISAVLALVVAALVHTGVIEVWHLIVIGPFQGAVMSFNVPARQAYIPELVGKEQLNNALAMDALSRNLSRLLAPAVAGVLLAWSPAVAFYTIAALYCGATLSMLRLPPASVIIAKSQGALADMMAGVRFILSLAVLRTLIVMAFVLVLLGMPFQQFLAVFQFEVLHVGPTQLGLMYAVFGVGSLVASLFLAYFADSPRKGLLQVVSAVALGASLSLFALSETFELSLAFLFLVGLASQVSLTTNNMLLLHNTDKALYGRVMSVNQMTWALTPVVALPIGALVDGLGAPATFSAMGVLLALLVLTIAALNPSSWRRTATPSSLQGGPQMEMATARQGEKAGGGA